MKIHLAHFSDELSPLKVQWLIQSAELNIGKLTSLSLLSNEIFTLKLKY